MPTFAPGTRPPGGPVPHNPPEAPEVPSFDDQTTPALELDARTRAAGLAPPAKDPRVAPRPPVLERPSAASHPGSVPDSADEVVFIEEPASLPPDEDIDESETQPLATQLKAGPAVGLAPERTASSLADASATSAVGSSATNAELTPAELTPAELTPAELTPAEPAPAEPAPAEPAPAEPAPAEPTLAEPAPAEPAPAEPKPMSGTEPVNSNATVTPLDGTRVLSTDAARDQAFERPTKPASPVERDLLPNLAVTKDVALKERPVTTSNHDDKTVTSLRRAQLLERRRAARWPLLAAVSLLSLCCVGLAAVLNVQGKLGPPLLGPLLQDYGLASTSSSFAQAPTTQADETLAAASPPQPQVPEVQTEPTEPGAATAIAAPTNSAPAASSADVLTESKLAPHTTAHVEPTPKERTAPVEPTPAKPVATAAKAAASPATQSVPGAERLARPVGELPSEVRLPVVQYFVEKAMQRARKCHLSGRATGSAMVTIAFGGDGVASDARVTGEPIASAPVASCIVTHARGVVIPNYQGPEFTVQAPIELR